MVKARIEYRCHYQWVSIEGGEQLEHVCYEDRRQDHQHVCVVCLRKEAR